jgi:hypothetical protein
MKHLSSMINQGNFCPLTNAPLPSQITAAAILKRIRKHIDAPAPEFKHACWRPISRKATA